MIKHTLYSDASQSQPKGLHIDITMDPDENILCEGYLRKIRGWGQNRTRWFRLTNKYISFHTKDAGDRIASCLVTELVSVQDDKGRRFKLMTSTPFGRTQNTCMILESPSVPVKNKWVAAFERMLKDADAPVDTESSERKETIYAEGYLNKVKHKLNALSRTRWFVCTSSAITYFEAEGGAEMASCSLDNVVLARLVDETTFEVVGREPFTKSGDSQLTLQCRDQNERDRWLQQLQKAMPTKVKVSLYSPLSSQQRDEADHFGCLIPKERSAGYLEAQEADAIDSQGNRFIGNKDL
eukprot:m.259220 g.259220  ORF g.259220 m.259220 type:complete len:296 (+) comp37707_c0_seq1:260-1147(+)